MGWTATLPPFTRTLSACTNRSASTVNMVAETGEDGDCPGLVSCFSGACDGEGGGGGGEEDACFLESAVASFNVVFPCRMGRFCCSAASENGSHFVVFECLNTTQLALWMMGSLVHFKMVVMVPEYGPWGFFKKTDSSNVLACPFHSALASAQRVTTSDLLSSFPSLIWETNLLQVPLNAYWCEGSSGTPLAPCSFSPYQSDPWTASVSLENPMAAASFAGPHAMANRRTPITVIR